MGGGLIWVLVIAGIAWLLWSRWRPSATHLRGNALSILEQRYANGEISGEEFREMREELRGRSQ